MPVFASDAAKSVVQNVIAFFIRVRLKVVSNCISSTSQLRLVYVLRFGQILYIRKDGWHQENIELITNLRVAILCLVVSCWLFLTDRSCGALD